MGEEETFGESSAWSNLEPCIRGSVVFGGDGRLERADGMSSWWKPRPGAVSVMCVTLLSKHGRCGRRECLAIRELVGSLNTT